MLESKIPEREALEYQKESLAKTMDTKAKVNACRFLYNLGCTSKRDALQRWRKYCQYYNYIMEKMKQRIRAIHKFNLTKAFNQLKGKKDDI